MATSAFKSTSRKGSAVGAKDTQPPAAAASRRRAHSVSAVSRKIHPPYDDNTSTSSEFYNSRDNPLFWADSSSPPETEECGKREAASNRSKQSNSFDTSAKIICNSNSDIKRNGRSIARGSSNSGVNNGIGGSLSRARARSVSRATNRGELHENLAKSSAQSWDEIKHIRSGMKTTVRNMFDARGHPENAVIKTIENLAMEWSENDSACSLRISNLDDETSTGSFTEAEERTTKTAIQTFQGNDSSRITASNVVDAPMNLENHGDSELISDIRRKYAIKLGESEERARKLRVDLAIEEQRGQELDRILNEILRDPITSCTQKLHRGRKKSNERKQMANRLTEEAMTYFDECVSLSTFDSSDFSASEDQLYGSVGVSISNGASSLNEGNRSSVCCFDEESSVHQKQLHGCFEDSNSGTTNKVSSAGQEYLFSFGIQQSQSYEFHEDLKCYIKNSERDTEKDIKSSTKSYYDADNYVRHNCSENVLIDRVLYNNRIDSGGLHLCGGAITFLTVASMI